jgi:hypothetical protein
MKITSHDSGSVERCSLNGEAALARLAALQAAIVFIS